MPTLKQAAEEFLAQKRIAVAGVSRKGDTAANAIYKKLRETGHEVFAVNPNAETVDGDACYANLTAIPGGVDAIVIGTPPKAAVELVRECAVLGFKSVWMHRSFGRGSVDSEAVRLCGELGIAVIPGACPMMFCEPVDPAHKCIRWIQRVTGGAPIPQDSR
ncbi:MAG TPA: CoA-binding protein [Armatimonadota bacterium]|jgi:hypothetical protein